MPPGLLRVEICRRAQQPARRALRAASVRESAGNVRRGGDHPGAGLRSSDRRSGDDLRRSAVTDIKAVIDEYAKTGLPAELGRGRESARTGPIANPEQLDRRPRLAMESRVGGGAPDARPRTCRAESGHVDDVNRVLRTYYDTRPRPSRSRRRRPPAGSAFGGREGENNSMSARRRTALPAFAKQRARQLARPRSDDASRRAEAAQRASR